MALLTIGGLIAWRLYRATPPDYLTALRQRTATTPDERLLLAESLENHFSAEISFASHLDDHGRPIPDASDTRFILLPREQINAWLDQRLPMWLHNRGVHLPFELSDVVCWSRNDALILGARARRGGFDKVVSVTIRFDFPAPGEADDAAVRVAGLRIGRLRVPLALVRSTLDDDEHHAGQMIDGLTFPAAQNIGGQPARWVGIHPLDEGLLIELHREDTSSP